MNVPLSNDLGSEQAFPRHDVTGSMRDGDGFVQTAVYGGTTKRELFAAMFLQGLLSNAYIAEAANGGDIGPGCIKAAVASADALLAALDGVAKCP